MESVWLWYTDGEKIDKYFTLNEADFMEECGTHTVEGLNPDQQYTLQLLAKNENGWSEPSEEFKIHIATPNPLKNVHVSSNQSHSLIKI